MALLDLFATARVTPAHAPRLSLARRLSLWRSRRNLAALDRDRLADIGVTPEAAAREARKGLWDAPESWFTR